MDGKPFSLSKRGRIWYVQFKRPDNSFSTPMMWIISCTTIPVTPGTQAIDSILTDGALDVKSPDSPQQAAEKASVKKVLTQARSDIVREEQSRITAETESKKSAQWAGVGKGFATLGIIGATLFIVGLGIRIAGKLPFP
jgi:hypothetical protein